MASASATVAVVHVPGEQPRTLASGEVHRLGEMRDASHPLVWLDVANPDEESVAFLRRSFDLHPLAEEDLQRRNQRPRIDTYPGQHVLIAYEVREADGVEAAALGLQDRLAELHLFLGTGYLVSVRWAASPAIDDVRRRFSRSGDPVGRSVGTLLYAILDAVVDGYFPLLDATAERIDALEDRIVEGGEVAGTLREVLDLKRELLELRRILAPQREVANSLLRRDVEQLDDEVIPYFQDLYDHLVRVLDQLDLYRDLVAAALDANLSVTSNNLNAVMKRLTAFTVVLMVPTLIAGIYGMNFRVMPELGWPFGYFLALGVMAAAMAGLAVFFWRRGWF
jgi:magnesium transporter